MKSFNFILAIFLTLLAPRVFAATTASIPDAKGPFPTKLSPATPFKFKLQIKLEAATLINFPCKVATSTNASQVQTDPATGKPALDANQKPILKTVAISAGTVLTGSEGYTLSTGVTIYKDGISNRIISAGRYAYLGDVPRFDPQNLELFASKMGHTLRVKAWVTQNTIDQYEQTLILRWKERYDFFGKSVVHLVPLQNLQTLADATKNPSLKKIYQVSAYYSSHYLDNSNSDTNIYDATTADYANRILLEILRKNMNDETLSIQDGLNLANQYLTDPTFAATRTTQSQKLFNAHLASRFVSTVTAATAPVTADPAARVGFLTFVYPIAVDKKGPFGEPNPGLRQFPLAGTIEARKWSDRWQDEFGGFPFLLITEDGVAFHGPITLVLTGSTSGLWMLRRADVSHSCMRMDPSDILELRELLPKDILSLEAKHQTIPLRIMEWPDVTDLNNDGKLEAVDVAYYLMQGSGDNINAAVNWKPRAIQKYFWQHTFTPYARLLSSHNTFTINTTTGEDGLPLYQGVFTGLPQYAIKNNSLVKSGFYPQEIPLQTMPIRPTAIIQYLEDGAPYNQESHDNGDNDSIGPAPPTQLMHGN